METSGRDKLDCILVISEKPIYRQVLKHLIEEASGAQVVTAANEESARHFIAELAPRTIILDSPDSEVSNLDCLFENPEKAVDVIVLGWKDNKLAIYSREVMESATSQNLFQALNRQERRILTGNK